MILNGTKDFNWAILQRYDEIEPYLVAVSAASDSNKNALGFIPRTVFTDFARRGELWAAVSSDGDERYYLGHLLFQSKYPRASVLQIYSDAKGRRHGVARSLLDELKRKLTSEGYLSISARVAADLGPSRDFWRKMDFRVQSVKAGGRSTGRQILVHYHELASPQLFSVSGLSATNPLGLGSNVSDEPPLFLIDLNVLFDVRVRRTRHECVIALLQAGQAGLCRIGISDEVGRELKRSSSKDDGTDPMLPLLKAFPIFTLPATEKVDQLEAELLSTIFPDRVKAKAVRPNDISDVRHLVTTIAHGAEGFVTSDQAILAQGLAMKERYGIRIVSPDEFLLPHRGLVQADSGANVGGIDVSVGVVQAEQYSAVRELLLAAGVSPSALAGRWGAAHSIGDSHLLNRYALWVDGQCVGYVSWVAWKAGQTLDACASISVTFSRQHMVARVLMRFLMAELGREGPIQIQLEVPDGQIALAEVANARGFNRIRGTNTLLKVSLGRVVTAENWSSVSDELAEATGIKLTKPSGQQSSFATLIEVLTRSGEKAYVPLSELERLLSPALFALKSQPAAMTPISPRYSQTLLGHSRQGSLLPATSASVHHRRDYICGPNVVKCLQPGMLILFYESGPKGEHVVAIARLLDAHLSPCDDAMLQSLERSALNEDELKLIGKTKQRTVMVLENIFALPKAVSRTKLLSVGFGSPNDLMTTRRVADEVVEMILREAYSRV